MSRSALTSLATSTRDAIGAALTHLALGRPTTRKRSNSNLESESDSGDIPASKRHKDGTLNSSTASSHTPEFASDPDHDLDPIAPLVTCGAFPAPAGTNSPSPPSLTKCGAETETRSFITTTRVNPNLLAIAQKEAREAVQRAQELERELAKLKEAHAALEIGAGRERTALVVACEKVITLKRDNQLLAAKLVRQKETIRTLEQNANKLRKRVGDLREDGMELN
jgi:hypothetical protein